MEALLELGPTPRESLASSSFKQGTVVDLDGTCQHPLIYFMPRPRHKKPPCKPSALTLLLAALSQLTVLLRTVSVATVSASIWVKPHGEIRA